MTADYLKLEDLTKRDIQGKKVLLRADLNLPFQKNKILDNTRLLGILPTLEILLKAKAKVTIISHFGRPEGHYNSSFSLSPLIDPIQDILKQELASDIEVKFASNCIGNVVAEALSLQQDKDILILENLRFHGGEKSNDLSFAKDLAANYDYYINDAFSCSHRSHASIDGITNFLPSYAGKLLEKEISSLEDVFIHSESPFVSVIGGSKISTKIDILSTLAQKSDQLIIGGAMANTMLVAQGVDVKNSLYEKDAINLAKEIFEIAQKNNCEIILPEDVVTADRIENPEYNHIVSIHDVGEGESIFDIGANTAMKWQNIISRAKTLIWNGPMGAFEFSPFGNSSITMARIIAYYTRYNGLNSVAGGGDTVAVIAQAKIKDSLSYISTAGGAFLEWIEGKQLPGITALEKNKKLGTQPYKNAS